MTTNSNIRSFAREHFAVLVSGGLFLLSALRVYYFVLFNPSVAFSVLSVANTTQILLSTLLSFVVFLSPLLLINKSLRTWMLAGNSPDASIPAMVRTGFVWVPIAPLILMTFSSAVLAGVVLSIGLWAINSWRGRRKSRRNPDAPPHPPVGSSKNAVWFATTVVGLAISMTLGTAWQDQEKISFQASKPIIGYVIGEQSGRVLILDGLRNPKWVAGSSITERELCASEVSWASSLSALIRNPGTDCSEQK